MKNVIIGANSTMAQSGIRTQIMHDGIIDYIKNLVDGFDDKYIALTEIGFKDDINKTGKMKVDIVINSKETGEAVLLIPVKAPISNFNQNAPNLANSTISETVRLNRHHPGINILFLTILGNAIPYYKNGGIFKKYETPNHVDLTDFLVAFTGTQHTKITFDINSSTAPTKDEFMNSFTNNNVTNVDTNDFDQKIRSILH